MVAELLHLESEDPDRDIAIYVNSPALRPRGLTVYDTIQFVKPTADDLRRDGLVDRRPAARRRGKGETMALPNAKILLHQVSGGFEGQATDIEIPAREVISVKRPSRRSSLSTPASRSRRSARHGARLLPERGRGENTVSTGHRAPLRNCCQHRSSPESVGDHSRAARPGVVGRSPATSAGASG